MPGAEGPVGTTKRRGADAETPENLSGGEDPTNGETEKGKCGTISGE